MTVTRKVRPADMNGSGSPVIGTSPIDIAMFMKTCANTRVETPMETSRPLPSAATYAVHTHGTRSAPKSASSATDPMNPASSA